VRAGRHAGHALTGPWSVVRGRDGAGARGDVGGAEQEQPRAVRGTPATRAPPLEPRVRVDPTPPPRSPFTVHR